MRSHFLAVALAAFTVPASAQELSHSAPWLGATFEVVLSGVTPGGVCRVFASTSGADVTTLFGVLEIDLALAFPLFVGPADPEGRVVLRLPIPEWPELAEQPLYLQALYDDPLHPAGASLTAAKKLRLLGSRFYTLLRQTLPGTYSLRLEVYSSPSLEHVFTIPFDLGCWQFDPAKVFVTRDGSAALYLACDGLHWLDNFFGETHVHLPMLIGHSTLTADGEHVLFATLGSASPHGIYRVALEMGAVPELLAHLPPTQYFAYDRERDAVWIERDGGWFGDHHPQFYALSDGDLLTSLAWDPGGTQSSLFLGAISGGLLGARYGPGSPFPFGYPMWFELARPGTPNLVVPLGSGNLLSVWQFGDSERFLVQTLGFGATHGPNRVFDVEHQTLVSVASDLQFRPMLPLVGEEALAYAATTGGRLYRLDPASATVVTVPGPDLPWAEKGALVEDFNGLRVGFVACEEVCLNAPRPIAILDPATGAVTQIDVVYAVARIVGYSIPGP